MDPCRALLGSVSVALAAHAPCPVVVVERDPERVASAQELVVALSIETVVLVFRLSQDAPEMLPYAASVGAAAALLLAAWGLFIRLNRSAEELEPEAMQAAKREDRKIEKAAKGDDKR